MLETLASQPLAAWYRHLLAREDQARQQLSVFAGRSARYRLGMLSVALVVQPDGQLGALEQGVVSPSVVVTLDPTSLPAALSDPSVMLRNMKVEGDLEFARVLSETLSRLRPDPAEDLSRLIGDAPAQRIVDAVSVALAQAQNQAGRLARQGTEFMMAESEQLLGRPELQRFAHEVASLQERLATLEAQVSSRQRGQSPS